MGRVRWSDVLCELCAHQIVSGGWRPRFFGLLKNDLAEVRCGGCREVIKRLLNQHHDGLVVSPYTWLDQASKQELASWHEAAHAVLGEHVGLRVDQAVVGKSAAAVAGSETELGGRVVWDLTDGPSVSVADYAAVCTAGAVVEARWLRERGWNTPENLLDVAFGSTYDMEMIANCADAVTDDTFAQGRADAANLIADQWHEIEDVSEELRRRGRLDRDAVKCAIRDGRRRRRAALAPPSIGGTTSPRAGSDLLAAPEPLTTTVSGRSTSMGIEEIKNTLAAASSEMNELRGMTAEVEQRSDAVRGQLAGVFSGADATEASEALNAVGRLLDQLAEATGLIGIAQQAIESYGARL